MASYYELQCKKITKLYPTGVHNSLQVKYAREADKAEAKARKKLLEELTK